MHLLDLGAGAGIVEQMNFRGKCARVCGVDLDPRVMENPWLDDARVSDAGEIPYADESFDIVVADNVMEHLAAPEEVLNEAKRVLRPGGHLLFKTPNRNHYMPMIARSTPHWFHEYFNRTRGREAEDTFATLYRLNSRSQLRRLAAATGFEVAEIALLEDRPEYLRFSALTYFIGMVYQRAVTHVPGLSGLRILLIGHLRKPN
ncbi:hypothetical protein U879_03520 [Defluviimonas sp. 20V17]|nr:hypothetical protein U879_03520 [Defluviimonas sp. 20V17]